MNTCPYAYTPFIDTPFIRRYAVFSDTQQQGLVKLFIALTRANCGCAHLSAQGMCGVGGGMGGGEKIGLVRDPQEASLDPQDSSPTQEEVALHGVGAKS
jgi:hypothetical protein